MQRVELLRRALLAKEISHDSQPVATSSSGPEFRSFSPMVSQSVPHAGSSVFLTEDDLPPSNQLEVPQIVVSDTMLLDPTGVDEHSIFLASHVANVLL
jgi:hypothetical protein